MVRRYEYPRDWFAFVRVNNSNLVLSSGTGPSKGRVWGDTRLLISEKATWIHTGITKGFLAKKTRLPSSRASEKTVVASVSVGSSGCACREQESKHVIIHAIIRDNLIVGSIARRRGLANKWYWVVFSLASYSSLPSTLSVVQKTAV